MWGAGGGRGNGGRGNGGRGNGGTPSKGSGFWGKQNMSPQKQAPQLREVHILSREHTIVLRSSTKGIDRPEFAKMREQVAEAGGILEIEIASFLTNINPDLISAINGTFYFNTF